jgi:hypothetical protein
MALYTDIKDHKNVVAKVTMLNISSSPVDHEENQNGRRKMASDAGRTEYIYVPGGDFVLYLLNHACKLLCIQHSTAFSHRIVHWLAVK